MWIMRDIKNNAWRLAHNLETSRQNCAGNPVANGIFTDLQPAGTQCRQRRCGIRLRDKRQRQIFQRAVSIAKRPVMIGDGIVPLNAPTL